MADDMKDLTDRADAELLAAAAQGDAEAYAEFFRRHVRAVTHFSVRRCSTPDEVADVVGDTFLVALQAANRYRPETPTALPWLFGIAARLVLRQRRVLAGQLRLLRKAAGQLPRYTGSEEDAVDEAIDAARQWPELEEALTHLSPAERLVLELVAYDGLTPTEVARVLDITPNAARLRLSRARKRIRTWLETHSHNQLEDSRVLHEQ